MEGFKTDQLPTPLARVVQRFEVIGPDVSADSFLILSYIVEAAVKLIALSLIAGIRSGSSEAAYANAYYLARADGLGDWEKAIVSMSSHPQAGYLSPDFHQALAWLTKRRPHGDELSPQLTAKHVNPIRLALGMEELEDRNLQSVRHVLRELVVVRNKTKAHGAFGPDFFASINVHYLELVRLLLSSCPLPFLPISARH